MKIIAFAALGSVALCQAALGQVAGAQTTTTTTQIQTRHTETSTTRPAVPRANRVCRVTYRHHQRIRTCRMTRS